MEGKIISLKEFYELKEQKEKELSFYKDKLLEIQDKVDWLQKELRLTKQIIQMIEEEKVHLIETTKSSK